MKKLGLDYIDLYLLHQPYGDINGTWRALEEAKKEGEIKSIGVSNMTPKSWEKFVPNFKTIPAVNQVEFNPYSRQVELKKVLDKYNKDVGQIILRFEKQEGIIVLPKSTHKARIASNLNIFDFSLTDDEIDQMRTLDKGHGSHNPDAPGVEEMLLSAFDVHEND